MLCIINTIRGNETIIVQSLRVWLQDRSCLSSLNCLNTLLYIIRKLWEQSKAQRVCASVFVFSFSSASHRTHHSPQTVLFPASGFFFLSHPICMNASPPFSSQQGRRETALHPDSYCRHSFTPSVYKLLS